MTERTPSPREDEEKMDLDSIYSKIQTQMRADRELTHMLVDELKHELLQAFKQKAQETSQPEQQSRREDNRPSHQRDYPEFRQRSFAHQMAAMDFKNRVDIKNEPVSMLPHNEYVVETMKKDIIKETSDLQTLLLNIDMHEKNHQGNADTDPDLNKLKAAYIDRATTLEGNKMQVERAASMAASFSSNMEMPKFRRAPPDITIPYDVLEPKNVLRAIQPFDEINFPNRLFRHVWTKVLQYGQKYYLAENDYKDILGTILYGNSLDDYQRMNSMGSSLAEMVGNLSKIYDKTPSLDDYKAEVDNFVRHKGETIIQAMARASTLIYRLRPTSSEAAWPEVSNNMRKSILKQIVHSTTKAHLTYEESKMLSSGGVSNVDSLITMAHQYEQAMGKMPEKEMHTAYQTASHAPKYSAAEIKKAQSTMEKVAKTEHKNDTEASKLEMMVDLLTNNINTQNETYKKMLDNSQRGRSKSRDNKSYPRSNSQDKRGRSTEKSVSFRSNSQSKERPSSLKRTDTPNKNHAPRSNSQSQERFTGKAIAPTTVKTIEGKHMYYCDPCTSYHMAHYVCYRYQKLQTEN